MWWGKANDSFTLINAGSWPDLPDLLVMTEPIPLSVCFIHDGTRRLARFTAAYYSLTSSSCVCATSREGRVLSTHFFYFFLPSFFFFFINRIVIRMTDSRARTRSHGGEQEGTTCSGKRASERLAEAVRNKRRRWKEPLCCPPAAHTKAESARRCFQIQSPVTQTSWDRLSGWQTLGEPS